MDTGELISRIFASLANFLVVFLFITRIAMRMKNKKKSDEKQEILREEKSLSKNKEIKNEEKKDIFNLKELMSYLEDVAKDENIDEDEEEFFDENLNDNKSEVPMQSFSYSENQVYTSTSTNIDNEYYKEINDEIKYVKEDSFSNKLKNDNKTKNNARKRALKNAIINVEILGKPTSLKL